MQLGIIETILEEIVAFSNQVNDGATVGAQANDNSISDDSKESIDRVRDGASDGALKILDEQVHTKVAAILNGLRQWTKRSDLFAQIGLTNHSTNRKKYLDPLFDF